MVVKLPSPHYYVFYNGEQEHDDVEELKLSYAFENFKDSGKYEWTALMLNINYGHNRELMQKCNPLHEYSILVSKIKEYKKTEGILENAVKRAVDECIEEGVLADYLRIHKAEVLDMVITEYDEEKTMKTIARDHEKIGEERGKKTTTIKIAKKLIKEDVDEAIICTSTGLSLEEIILLKKESDN